MESLREMMFRCAVKRNKVLAGDKESFLKAIGSKPVAFDLESIAKAYGEYKVDPRGKVYQAQYDKERKLADERAKHQPASRGLGVKLVNLGDAVTPGKYMWRTDRGRLTRNRNEAASRYKDERGDVYVPRAVRPPGGEPLIREDGSQATMDVDGVQTPVWVFRNKDLMPYYRGYRYDPEKGAYRHVMPMVRTSKEKDALATNNLAYLDEETAKRLAARKLDRDLRDYSSRLLDARINGLPPDDPSDTPEVRADREKLKADLEWAAPVLDYAVKKYGESLVDAVKEHKPLDWKVLATMSDELWRKNELENYPKRAEENYNKKLDIYHNSPEFKEYERELEEYKQGRRTDEPVKPAEPVKPEVVSHPERFPKMARYQYKTPDERREEYLPDEFTDYAKDILDERMRTGAAPGDEAVGKAIEEVIRDYGLKSDENGAWTASGESRPKIDEWGRNIWLDENGNELRYPDIADEGRKDPATEALLAELSRLESAKPSNRRAMKVYDEDAAVADLAEKLAGIANQGRKRYVTTTTPEDVKREAQHIRDAERSQKEVNDWYKQASPENIELNTKRMQAIQDYMDLHKKWDAFGKNLNSYIEAIYGGASLDDPRLKAMLYDPKTGLKTHYGLKFDKEGRPLDQTVKLNHDLISSKRKNESLVKKLFPGTADVEEARSAIAKYNLKNPEHKLEFEDEIVASKERPGFGFIPVMRTGKHGEAVQEMRLEPKKDQEPKEDQESEKGQEPKEDRGSKKDQVLVQTPVWIKYGPLDRNVVQNGRPPADYPMASRNLALDYSRIFDPDMYAVRQMRDFLKEKNVAFDEQGRLVGADRIQDPKIREVAEEYISKYNPAKPQHAVNHIGDDYFDGSAEINALYEENRRLKKLAQLGGAAGVKLGRSFDGQNTDSTSYSVRDEAQAERGPFLRVMFDRNTDRYRVFDDKDSFDRYQDTLAQTKDDSVQDVTNLYLAMRAKFDSTGDHKKLDREDPLAYRREWHEYMKDFPALSETYLQTGKLGSSLLPRTPDEVTAYSEEFRGAGQKDKADRLAAVSGKVKPAEAEAGPVQNKAEPKTPEEVYRESVGLANAGRYSDAIRGFAGIATEYPLSYARLADLQMEGRGVSKNKTRAAKYYELAYSLTGDGHSLTQLKSIDPTAAARAKDEYEQNHEPEQKPAPAEAPAEAPVKEVPPAEEAPVAESPKEIPSETPAEETHDEKPAETEPENASPHRYVPMKGGRIPSAGTQPFSNGTGVPKEGMTDPTVTAATGPEVNDEMNDEESDKNGIVKGIPVLSFRDMIESICKSDSKEGHPYGRPIQGNVFVYGSTQSVIGIDRDKLMPEEVPAGRVNGDGITVKKVTL